MKCVKICSRQQCVDVNVKPQQFTSSLVPSSFETDKNIDQIQLERMRMCI